MTSSDTTSVVERTRPVVPGAAVIAVRFLGSTAVFVLAEEALLLVPADGDERRVEVHSGGIVSAASADARIVTGGDDGQVVATGADGAVATVARDTRRRWIDQVAVGPDGAIAWSAGKTASVRTAKGVEKSLDVPSSVGGLAFAPKGFRLAVAHYGGVSLWFPNAAVAPEALDWRGSHLGLTISPDGKFLITTMQEPTLHGWRLADRKHMRMAGYQTKVRSVDWSAGGRWLATGGSDQLILWPFQGKDGPMGRTPRMLAPSPSRVAVVACHPTQDVVAAGFEDGLVLLVRIEDGAEIIARRPGSAPVSALAWDAAGSKLAFGTEDGEAGIVGF
ncbi:MAG TPA: WD40 repeat domain-containing protein [Xanthobacteraceae bacterium]|nr:WD40 repeat domain-containing protein [Xanthobacteraceae bacterium]